MRTPLIAPRDLLAPFADEPSVPAAMARSCALCAIAQPASALHLPTKRAYDIDLDSCRAACVALLAPDHSLVSSDIDLDGRPSLGAVQLKRVDRSWEARKRSCYSMSFLDAPQDVYTQIEQTPAQPEMVLMAFWAAALVAGRRSTPVASIDASKALIDQFGLAIGPCTLVAEIESRLGEWVPRGTTQ